MKWFVLLAVLACAKLNSAQERASAGSSKTSCRCGWANRRTQTKIVGGTFYRQNEFPFIAGLAFKSGQGYSSFCGGAIITANHVLTAAHCTDRYTKNKKPIYVLLGTHDRSKAKSNAVIIAVSKISQGNWNKSTKQHDIALLTLRRSIKFNSIIGPVCMPLPGLDVPGRTVTIIGWGAEKFKGTMITRPKKLLTTHLTAAACASAYPEFVKKTNPTHICTLSKGQSACQGDSGGPIVWHDPQTNRYTLVGLVSFGPNCTDIKPSVQTKVEPYLSWIQSQISKSRPAKTCRKIRSG